MSNFTEDFRATVEDVERRARAVGMSISELCRRAGAARATPDRWREATPKTIELVTKMQEVVAAAERESEASDGPNA